MDAPVTRDPIKQAAGRAGAIRRWGTSPQRTVKLDDLSAVERRLVLALIEAVRDHAAEVDHDDRGAA